MASSSDENLSDSDEDMISCHICLMRFNTSDRKPKFLDCHHYFCLNCIKVFANVINVACPTCRNLTKMSGRQLEDLATNNMALRFVTRIATERARELAEQGQKEQANFITQNKSSVAVLSPLGKCNQMWCSQCSVFSTAACRQKKHKLIDSIQVSTVSTSLSTRFRHQLKIYQQYNMTNGRVDGLASKFTYSSLGFDSRKVLG